MEIISNQNVETQEQLQALLQKEGFRCTQATISRDIKDMRIVKELTSLGTYRYTVSGSEMSSGFSTRLNTIFRECVIGYDYANNLIVLRTLPALASAAGSAVAGTSGAVTDVSCGGTTVSAIRGSAVWAGCTSWAGCASCTAA